VISYLNDVKCVIVVTENNNIKKKTLKPPTQNNRTRSRLFGFFNGSTFLGKLKRIRNIFNNPYREKSKKYI
jgi:hypothetical protein